MLRRWPYPTIAGVYDLRPRRYSSLQPKIFLSHEIIYTQSPLCNIPAPGPPLLISFGSLESKELQRQSLKYHSAWQEAGHRSSLLRQESKDHFSIIEELAASTSTLSRALAEFLLAR